MFWKKPPPDKLDQDVARVIQLLQDAGYMSGPVVVRVQSALAEIVMLRHENADLRATVVRRELQLQLLRDRQGTADAANRTILRFPDADEDVFPGFASAFKRKE